MEGKIYGSTGVHSLTFHFHTQQQEDGDNYRRKALILRILHPAQNNYIKEDVMSGKCSVNWYGINTKFIRKLKKYHVGDQSIDERITLILTLSIM
jgi:hypothetical protein